VWEGAGVVASARKLIGATNPLAAEPGTIRGDFAIEVGRNIVHGSDSVENGERETGVRALGQKINQSGSRISSDSGSSNGLLHIWCVCVCGARC
jgi:Nucleoside diphosphate kinase